MAAPRAFPLCGTFFSRSLATLRATSSSASLVSRVAIPQRQFTSGMRFMEAYVATPATEAEEARSIALLKLPKRATKSDIQDYLQLAGVDVKRIQLRFDRFTFHNDTMCFVELGDEKQARKATEILSHKRLLDEKIFVKTPLNHGFYWTQGSKPDAGTSGSRYLPQDEESPALAVKPLLEGRRVMLSVQTPGWGDGATSTRIKSSREVMQNHLGRYGIEAISGISPFHGDKTPNPRLLCFLDFETKEGADAAIEAFHDKEIEGRKVWLQISKTAPWRANQMGKVQKEVLVALQEKGIVGQEVYEDKFPLKKRDDKKSKNKSKGSRTREAKVQVE